MPKIPTAKSAAKTPVEIVTESVRAFLSVIHKTAEKSTKPLVLALLEEYEATAGQPVGFSGRSLLLAIRPGLGHDGDEKIRKVLRGFTRQINTSRRLLETWKAPSGITLSISGAPYKLEASFPKTQEMALRPSSSLPDSSFSEWFWDRFLDKEDYTRFFIPEPLFFRNSQMLYVRDIYCNEFKDEHLNLAALAHKYLGGSKEGEKRERTKGFRPVRHYVSTGEVMGFVHLLKMYHEKRCGLLMETMRTHLHLENFPNKPFILSGSSRTNYLVNQIQRDLKLLAQVGENSVTVSKNSKAWLDRSQLGKSLLKKRPNPSNSKHEELHDTVAVDSTGNAQPDCFFTFAVVTRMLEYAGRPVLMTVANHGRAVEGAFSWLADEKNLDEVALKYPKYVKWKSTTYLQFVFQVEVRRPGRGKWSDEAEVNATRLIGLTWGPEQ